MRDLPRLVAVVLVVSAGERVPEGSDEMSAVDRRDELSRFTVDAVLRHFESDPTMAFERGSLWAFAYLEQADRPLFLDAMSRLPRRVADEIRGELRRAPQTNGTEAPRIRTAAELLGCDFTPIRWLIPGLLPEGLILLAARPKIGKSWLALDVAIACATGGKVFGRPVARGDVLYLALEDNDRRMHSRLSKLGATGAGLGDLAYATEWPRGAEGAHAIHEWINAHPNARLVVIDVFTKLRAMAEGRETAYSVDYLDVSMLKPPADRAVSVLLVHHTRKAQSDDPLDSVSGTLGIGGAADGAWILNRARGEDEAELHLVGRDLEEEGSFAVRFDRESCRWQWVGEAWKVRISAERRQVLDALAGEPMRPHELAKALGKPQGAVRKMIHDMAQDGQIERGVDGRYRPIEPEGTYR